MAKFNEWLKNKAEENYKDEFHPVNMSLYLKYRKRMYLLLFKIVLIDIVLISVGIMLLTHDNASVAAEQLQIEHAIGLSVLLLGVFSFITSLISMVIIFAYYFVKRHVLKVSKHSLTQAYVESTKATTATI